MNNELLPKQEAAQADHVPQGMSFAMQGMWVLLSVLVYFVAVSALISYERRTLSGLVHELEEVHQQEERQVSLNLTVARAILTVNENYFSPNIEGSVQMLILENEAVLTGLHKLKDAYPRLADDIVALEQTGGVLLSVPSRAAVADMRSAFHRLVIELDSVTSDIRGRKTRLLDDYRDTFNRVTLEWLLLVIAGIAAFGGVGWAFFRRLVADIEAVRTRAIDIVRGYRGDPLPVKRGDEIGALMSAVNGMQSELRERETRLELVRQQQFHKEKMAAVGSLATAVAHEINNPLSAIAGVAQVIANQSTDRHCGENGAQCQPQLILDQARRVMHITRQISDFSVPQSPVPRLIDLNGLVRSTCGFVGFDRRFRGIEMIENLDRDLPAIRAVADHLVQVLMNLLINAADAIDDRLDSQPRIEVSTHADGHWVRLAVTDNGVGILPENIDKVFVEHFTTKPPGLGSGLGLSLCRSLIKAAGGDIEIESVHGVGTVVTIVLPVPQTGEAQP